MVGVIEKGLIMYWNHETTRRKFLAMVAASASTFAVASQADAFQLSTAEQPMTVYRDPGCECCVAWANLAR